MIEIISSIKAKALIEQGAQLVDVRTAKEFSQGAAPGAVNLPINMLAQQAQNLDLKKPVIVYCRTGGRSAMAQQILQSIGFSQVHNVGSIDNYLY